MTRRTRGCLAAGAVTLTLALGITLTTACAPDPSPTPSPSTTGFASEEEAFAAAEATYRAYVDALNEVDLSDPATFEPVFSTLSGSALEDEKKSLSEMHADQLTVSGESEVVGFYLLTTTPLTTVACLDVSAVALTDANGVSQVSDTRPDVYSFEVSFYEASGTSLRIESMSAIEDQRCAGS
ncbi:MAG: hypothetical protein QM677_11395 [Microbacterium sp.]